MSRFTFEICLIASVTIEASDPNEAIQQIAQRFDGHLTEIEGTLDAECAPLLYQIDDEEIQPREYRI